MNSKIWLSSPHMGGKEQDFINEAFDKRDNASIKIYKKLESSTPRVS